MRLNLHELPPGLHRENNMHSAGTPQLLPYKKTRWMNLIGGAVIGFGAITASFGTESLGKVAVILAGMGFFVLVAFGTARALSQTANAKLVKIMLWLNWSMIGIYALGAVAIVLGTFASPDVLARMLVKYLPGALTFVVPQSINIIALKTVGSTR